MDHFLPQNAFYMDPNLEPVPDHLKLFDYDNIWAIWPVIIMTVLVYLVVSEIGSQDCTTQKCNNKLTPIYETDTTVEMIDKINEGLRKNHRTVTWRISMICAIIISIFIVSFFYATKMISGIVMFLLILVIFFIVAAIFSWFNAHYYRQISYKEEQTLQELRHKVQVKKDTAITSDKVETKFNSQEINNIMRKT